jgi:methylthioribose-1-phosphate isomerase
MVPEALAGPGRRGADLGLHGRLAARRARGLEAALVDRSIMTVASLEERDSRTFDIRVAGSGALLVAKLHKIADRSTDRRRRSDKDAMDILRLLRGVTTVALAASVRELLMDGRSAEVAAEALQHLERLFGSAAAEGSQMAARSAELLENAAEIAASCTALAGDLLAALQP